MFLDDEPYFNYEGFLECLPEASSSAPLHSSSASHSRYSAQDTVSRAASMLQRSYSQSKHVGSHSQARLAFAVRESVNGSGVSNQQRREQQQKDLGFFKAVMESTSFYMFLTEQCEPTVLSDYLATGEPSVLDSIRVALLAAVDVPVMSVPLAAEAGSGASPSSFSPVGSADKSTSTSRFAEDASTWPLLDEEYIRTHASSVRKQQQQQQQLQQELLLQHQGTPLALPRRVSRSGSGPGRRGSAPRSPSHASESEPAGTGSAGGVSEQRAGAFLSAARAPGAARPVFETPALVRGLRLAPRKAKMAAPLDKHSTSMESIEHFFAVAFGNGSLGIGQLKVARELCMDEAVRLRATDILLQPRKHRADKICLAPSGFMSLCRLLMAVLDACNRHKDFESADLVRMGSLQFYTLVSRSEDEALQASQAPTRPAQSQQRLSPRQHVPGRFRKYVQHVVYEHALWRNTDFWGWALRKAVEEYDAAAAAKADSNGAAEQAQTAASPLPVRPSGLCAWVDTPSHIIKGLDFQALHAAHSELCMKPKPRVRNDYSYGIVGMLEPTPPAKEGQAAYKNHFVNSSVDALTPTVARRPNSRRPSQQADQGNGNGTQMKSDELVFSPGTVEESVSGSESEPADPALTRLESVEVKAQARIDFVVWGLVDIMYYCLHCNADAWSLRNWLREMQTFYKLSEANVEMFMQTISSLEDKQRAVLYARASEEAEAARRASQASQHKPHPPTSTLRGGSTVAQALELALQRPTGNSSGSSRPPRSASIMLSLGNFGEWRVDRGEGISEFARTPVTVPGICCHLCAPYF